MASAIGAQLANLTSYWGTPSMLDPEITKDGQPVPQFEWGRGAPSSIIVNSKARGSPTRRCRTTTSRRHSAIYDGEAAEFPNAGPAYLIFDRTVRDSQRILSMYPGQPDPDWVTKADTIADLAAKADLDPDALQATVDRYNEHAARGEDPDFQRHKVGLMAPGQSRADHRGAVLRRADIPGHARHQRRPADRPQWPGPPPRWRRHQRAVCRRATRRPTFSAGRTPAAAARSEMAWSSDSSQVSTWPSKPPAP